VATKQIDHACPGELLNPKVTSRLVDGETLGEIFLAAFRGDRPNFGQLKDEYGSILGETADRVKLKELLGGSPAQVAPMFEGSISLDLPDELKKSRSQIRLHIVSQDGKVLDTADIARGRAHFGILLENIPKDAALLIETANKVNLNTPISELTAAYDNQHTAA
jgi:hypothetical protein